MQVTDLKTRERNPQLRLFNLYPGEEKKAGLFSTLAFLWSFGGYGLLILSEGMFLEKVGAHSLPPVYLGIALGMCVISALLLYVLHKFSLNYLLISVILNACLLSFGLIVVLLLSTHSASPAFWIFFKIIGWIIPVITYICFWAFVDQYFDLQDAKRFFCLFNSITFLGDAFAGGLVSITLESWGLVTLLSFFSFLMLSSLPCVFRILKQVKPVTEGSYEDIQQASSLTLHSLLSTLLKSRFTLLLMFLFFCMQILAITTEYNTMASFEGFFKKEHEGQKLTEFLGTCGMCVSLANMIFCLFFYSRLVKKIGVSNIILVSPLFFLVTFLLWSGSDILPIALLGFVAREGMVYSFDDNNLNLLISGVPTKAKNQVRIAIESFFEPVGMLVSALLLIFFQEESHSLGLLLACLATGCVVMLRSEYHKAIFQNLVANAIRFEKKATDWIAALSKREVKEFEFYLLSNMRKAEESTQLLAYEYLLKIDNPRLLPRLLNQLGKLSIPGKLKAIDLLSASCFAKENVVIEYLEKWRRLLPHPSLKSSIHFYFARHTHLKPEHVLPYLQNEHLGLRGAAILSLKTSSASNVSFADLATTKLSHLLHSTDDAEIAMGLLILELDPHVESLQQILSFFSHPSLVIRRAAAKALIPIAHAAEKSVTDFLVSLLPFIQDGELRNLLLDALLKTVSLDSVKPLILSSVHFRPLERKKIEILVLGMGKMFSSDLLEILCDHKIHVRCRLLAGKILGKLSLKELRAHLFNLIKDEIQRAYFYFYHAHETGDADLEQDGTVLRSALITGYEAIIDFIIQLLGVAGSLEESDVLSHTLRSKNRKIRAHAIETLEKTCDPHIFALLEPLLDDKKPEDKFRAFFKQGGTALTTYELLEKLAQSGSRADQIVSLTLQARLNAPGWREALEAKMHSQEKIFHNVVLELLQTGDVQ